MQSLTVMQEQKLNRPFCLPYQRHPHQLHLLVVKSQVCLCSHADVTWMSLSIEQSMFTVAFSHVV